jgi:hypothetical protein
VKILAKLKRHRLKNLQKKALCSALNLRLAVKKQNNNRKFAVNNSYIRRIIFLEQ